MDFLKKYSLQTKLKKSKDIVTLDLLQKLVDTVKGYEDKVYIVGWWHFPYNKQLSCIVSDLSLAFLLNKCDNIKVILAPEDKIKNILKQEWVREYFSKQMPEYMIEDILGLIHSGEEPESAWDYCLENWLPNHKTLEYLLPFQNKED